VNRFRQTVNLDYNDLGGVGLFKAVGALTLAPASRLRAGSPAFRPRPALGVLAHPTDAEASRTIRLNH
jgi:hypothetical protein